MIMTNNRYFMMWRSEYQMMVALLLTLTVTAFAQNPTAGIGDVTPGPKDDRCASRTSCSECISAGPKCAWCKGKVTGQANPLDRRRCDDVDLLKLKCTDYYHPQPVPLKTKNLPFGKTADGNIVQLRPQRIRVPIKPNSPQTITVQYQQADDYPVDLYYLMDLSYSMNDDKAKLEALGEEIGKTMGSITSNYQLGFGSFVDKRVAPFVEEFPSKLKNPCGKDTPCASPYGFVNHLTLSKDAKNFATQVRKSNISGNLDAPEGGLDAIMQTIVCTREIGWRDTARKIILVATDEGFHMAGDGKLGGIVLPNDGYCHLNTKGEYTESVTQDYPSISHINWKAKQHKINIIFAVTTGVHNIYKQLTNHIEGSYSGELSGDSSNVVDLIRDIYNEISSSVTLNDNSTDSADIRLSYRPYCPIVTNGARNADNQFSEKPNTCKNIKVGMTVSFDIEINLSSCPKRVEDRRQTLQVYPIGINEELLIDIDVQCECQCGNKEVRSPQCSKVGDLDCGTCTCPKHKAGLSCQCDSNRVNVSESDITPCKSPNSSNLCSGRGSCICGLCLCNQPENPDHEVYGTFCEFDNFNCKREGGEICGGPNRGECIGGPGGGHCECAKGWTGDTCSCPDDDRDCLSADGEQCSGKGVCKCGICDCKVKTKFQGKVCEDWIPRAKCDVAVRDCVMCNVFVEWAEEERLPCLQCNITVEQNVTDEGRNEQKCELYKDAESCYYYYFQELSAPPDVGRIRFNYERECPTAVNAFMIGGPIIGAILAIGIALLLIWKILTTIHDRRDFAKFEKDRQAAKWEKGLNPIYRQPVATFSNPMYNTGAEATGSQAMIEN